MNCEIMYYFSTLKQIEFHYFVNSIDFVTSLCIVCFPKCSLEYVTKALHVHFSLFIDSFVY